MKSKLRHISLLTSLLLTFANVDDCRSQHHDNTRSPFARADFGTFMTRTVQVNEPCTSMKEMGFSGQLTSGRLVDHNNRPLANVSVALLYATDGPWGGSYKENYAVTDDDGRFTVVGNRQKRRILFHRLEDGLPAFRQSGNERSDTNVWVAEIKQTSNLQTFIWPKLQTVHWSPPNTFPNDVKNLTFRSRTNAARRFAPVFHADQTDDGAFEAKLFPGEYVVTFDRSFPLMKHDALTVEIGEATVRSGEPAALTLYAGIAAVGGTTGEPNGHYVSIERLKKWPYYQDVFPAVFMDLIEPKDDGFFLSRRLPVGQYLVRLHTKNRGYAAPLHVWSVSITPDSKTINLARRTPDNSLRGQMESILATRSEYSGIHHLLYALGEDKAAVTRELFEMCIDPASPWSQKTFRILMADAEDSKELLNALMALLLSNSEDPFWRYKIGRRLQQFETHVPELIELMPSLMADSRIEVQSVGIQILESISMTHDKVMSRVVKILAPAIELSPDSNRASTAIVLGRLKQDIALPALRKLRSNGTDLEPAFLIWQMDGDSDDFFMAANESLQAGLFWQRVACSQILKVAESEDVPEGIQQRLRTIAETPVDNSSCAEIKFTTLNAVKTAKEILALSGNKTQ